MSARRVAGLAAAALLVSVAIASLLVFLLRPSDEARRQPSAPAPIALVPAGQREPLPALSGRTVDPPPARLDVADLRGMPLLIEVWASWCPSCKEGAPMLARLARSYRGTVRFVGIDTQDTLGDARAFVRRYRLDFPHLYDPDTALAARLGVYGVPTMLLVDREGRIAATLIGKQNEATLRRYLGLVASP